MTETTHGLRCQGCGRAWVTIRNTAPPDVGQAGIAHYGVLTTTELETIRVFREAEDVRIEDAMREAAT